LKPPKDLYFRQLRGAKEKKGLRGRPKQWSKPGTANILIKSSRKQRDKAALEKTKAQLIRDVNPINTVWG